MLRILVIDDDRHMRNVCSRVLSNAGWLVSCAETGDEGLAAVLNSIEKIDVVLLDQLMPGLSGMDVLDQIREANPNLPVVIMTGSMTEESAQEILKRGASDCLSKPFTPEQLREAIRKAAGSAVIPAQ
jgi:DNA-binding NtrC family response regulator